MLAGVDFFSSAGMFCDVVSISLLPLFPPPSGVIKGMEEGWFRLLPLRVAALFAVVDWMTAGGYRNATCLFRLWL